MAASSLEDSEEALPHSSMWARDAFNKYLLEYDRWFGTGSDLLPALLEQAMDSQLSGWQLRSLAWRLFLQVLPGDSSSWTLVTAEHRRVYAVAKRTYSDYTDINDTRIDCTVNNPLSVDEESPWHRLFEHAELRRVIRQDVVRAMPEVALFRDEAVRRSMTDILFVFMQKHPEVEYVQGMHELLAPIIYLLMKEYNNFADVRGLCPQEHPTMDLLEVLMDKDYVEHDAFHLLEKVLLMMDWSGSVNRQREYDSEPRLPTPPQRPFAKERMCAAPAQWEPSPCNRAVRQHLRFHDYNLYLKLVELGVEPQVYGLKVFRVLFGREFRLPELCCVWDALFADSYDTSAVGLVPYLFCAILVCHRAQILALDGMEALTLLMNLPPVSNISACVAFALHLRAPQTHPRPEGFAGGPPSPRKVPLGSVQLRRRKSVERLDHTASSREQSPAARVAVARPRSMTQPLAVAGSAPAGRTLARRHRSGADKGLVNGIAASPVNMEDVSQLREKHAKMAVVETAAYCVMESQQTQTPLQWNPGLAGVPSRLQRAVNEQAECVTKLEALLSRPDDLDLDVLREMLIVQKQLMSELRGYVQSWTALPETASPSLSRRGRRPNAGGGPAAERRRLPVEEVTPEAGGSVYSQLPVGLSPAYDTLDVDVANLSLAEPGDS